MSEPELRVTRAEGVATLWLNRPAKRNAVTYDMWCGIASTCTELAADETVRVLVVRGTGEHFCAGADIGQLATVDTAEYHAANEAADEALAAFPKPTVAFVVGSCVGGGAEIAIACDVRIADATARFGITPARLGIVYPAFAMTRAVRLLGSSAAKHLLYSAELIDAARALRIGLIDEVHAPPEAEQRLDAFTDLLATQRSQLTQQATKAMIDEIERTGTVAPVTAAYWAEEVARSGESAEGFAAFAEHRTPRFGWTRRR